MLTAAHLGHLITMWVTACLSSSVGAQMGRDWAAVRGASRPHLGLVWMERLGDSPVMGGGWGSARTWVPFTSGMARVWTVGPSNPVSWGSCLWVVFPTPCQTWAGPSDSFLTNRICKTDGSSLRDWVSVASVLGTVSLSQITSCHVMRTLGQPGERPTCWGLRPPTT